LQKNYYIKKITLSLFSLCFLLSTQATFAQAKKQPAKKTATTTEKKVAKKKLSPEEEQKAWMEYATPGEVHKMMAQSNGEWTGTVTQWMTPNAEPMKSECNASVKMIMDGRYQTTEMKSNMMGMPFEGLGTLAYDNVKKVFINTWIDNMGTGLTVTQGVWNEKTQSITFKGKMVDAAAGCEIDIREVFTIKDEKTQMIQMFSPSPDGKGEFKTMEIILTKG
jgi:hypothetical protein